MAEAEEEEEVQHVGLAELREPKGRRTTYEMASPDVDNSRSSAPKALYHESTTHLIQMLLRAVPGLLAS